MTLKKVKGKNLETSHIIIGLYVKVNTNKNLARLDVPFKVSDNAEATIPNVYALSQRDNRRVRGYFLTSSISKSYTTEFCFEADDEFQVIETY
jgi:hypothetical protein